MSALGDLKDAKSLHDLANILGYKPKHLAYLVRVMPAAVKYTEFNIPKRSGGHRVISAPRDELKQLQRRLSDLLQDCLEEIEAARNIRRKISHGFKRGGSITTNAAAHRRNRYVFNLDLADFFGTINFGRVRGFFIKSRDFALTPEVSTLIAQIACHNNALPQGSPCSPIISNLIGNILDMRLFALARSAGCSYSRYADDLTFSTSKDPFPSEIAIPTPGDLNLWQLGSALTREIAHADFQVNHLKTRMQYRKSRQTVTGIVVNKRLNTRIEYRRLARAMTHRLLLTGEFEILAPTLDASGQTSLINQPGRIQQLEGVLTHILSVDKMAARHEVPKKREKKNGKSEPELTSNEKLLRDLLFYKNFAASDTPTILTEGKTDRVYLSCAIKSLSANYPNLADAAKSPPKLSINLFKFTERTDRLFHVSGGTGDFADFLKNYRKHYKRIHSPKGMSPVILLLDNDSGSKPVLKFLESYFKISLSGKTHLHIFDNVYILLTPLKAGAKESCMEDCFSSATLSKKLNGKSFNYSGNINAATEYGKQAFAERVVKADAHSIEFSGFKSLLDEMASIITTHTLAYSAAHPAKATAAPPATAKATP